MIEREPRNFDVGLNLPILSEIQREYKEKFTLFDYNDALLVDDKLVLAYKRLFVPGIGDADKILVARERTTPIKIEKSGREVIYPYPDEERLRGLYGVLIIGVSENRPVFYIGEQYKLVFEQSFYREGKRFADIMLESTKPIRLEFVDGRMDYNEYLRLLNNTKNQHSASI